MPMSISITPTKANRFRAALAANPSADPVQLAKKLGIDRGEAVAAVSRKLARRKTPASR
jgi:hypothetical protein